MKETRLEMLKIAASFFSLLQENVTLLHWAAINNRREIVQYFLQLGADCNAVGGELMSTPLHWATRSKPKCFFQA